MAATRRDATRTRLKRDTSEAKPSVSSAIAPTESAHGLREAKDGVTLARARGRRFSNENGYSPD